MSQSLNPSPSLDLILISKAEALQSEYDTIYSYLSKHYPQSRRKIVSLQKLERHLAQPANTDTPDTTIFILLDQFITQTVLRQTIAILQKAKVKFLIYPKAYPEYASVSASNRSDLVFKISVLTKTTKNYIRNRSLFRSSQMDHRVSIKRENKDSSEKIEVLIAKSNFTDFVDEMNRVASCFKEVPRVDFYRSRRLFQVSVEKKYTYEIIIINALDVNMYEEDLLKVSRLEHVTLVIYRKTSNEYFIKMPETLTNYRIVVGARHLEEFIKKAISKLPSSTISSPEKQRSSQIARSSNLYMLGTQGSESPRRSRNPSNRMSVFEMQDGIYLYILRPNQYFFDVQHKFNFVYEAIDSLQNRPFPKNSFVIVPQEARSWAIKNISNLKLEIELIVFTTAREYQTFNHPLVRMSTNKLEDIVMFLTTKRILNSKNQYNVLSDPPSGAKYMEWSTVPVGRNKYVTVPKDDKSRIQEAYQSGRLRTSVRTSSRAVSPLFLNEEGITTRSGSGSSLVENQSMKSGLDSVVENKAVLKVLVQSPSKKQQRTSAPRRSSRYDELDMAAPALDMLRNNSIRTLSMVSTSKQIEAVAKQYIAGLADRVDVTDQNDESQDSTQNVLNLLKDVPSTKQIQTTLQLMPIAVGTSSSLKLYAADMSNISRVESDSKSRQHNTPETAPLNYRGHKNTSPVIHEVPGAQQSIRSPQKAAKQGSKSDVQYLYVKHPNQSISPEQYEYGFSNKNIQTSKVATVKKTKLVPKLTFQDKQNVAQPQVEKSGRSSLTRPKTPGQGLKRTPSSKEKIPVDLVSPRPLSAGKNRLESKYTLSSKKIDNQNPNSNIFQKQEKKTHSVINSPQEFTQVIFFIENQFITKLTDYFCSFSCVSEYFRHPKQLHSIARKLNPSQLTFLIVDSNLPVSDCLEPFREFSSVYSVIFQDWIQNQYGVPLYSLQDPNPRTKRLYKRQWSESSKEIKNFVKNCVKLHKMRQSIVETPYSSSCIQVQKPRQSQPKLQKNRIVYVESTLDATKINILLEKNKQCESKYSIVRFINFENLQKDMLSLNRDESVEGVLIVANKSNADRLQTLDTISTIYPKKMLAVDPHALEGVRRESKVRLISLSSELQKQLLSL